MQIHQGRKDLVFFLLGGVFITNAIVAELIGGKLIQIGSFTMSMGVLPWPIVFLTTDLLNEYYGKEGVKKLTFMTVALIIYTFIVLFAGMMIPAASFSPVDDNSYSIVFGQSLWIIVGSIIAFIVSQLLDVTVFWLFRNKTGGKHLWLRSTGSTVFSQLIDTFIVLGIAFWLPGKISTSQFLNMSATNYTYKLFIALGLTPFIYLGHAAIHRYLHYNPADKEDIKLR